MNQDDFLQSKASNFRTFVLSHNPDSEVINQIKGFSPNLLNITLRTVFLPLVKSQGIESMADELMTHLKPTIPSGEVRSKIIAYLSMFQEVLT